MIKIIAHRGVSSEAPENTLSAVRAAITLKSDYVEVDLRLTKDKIPILIHDKNLLRTGRRKLTVADLEYEKIKQYEVGSWFNARFTGESVPSLAELLKESWEEVGLMLELKECPQPAALVVSAICSALQQAKNLPTKLLLGSFSFEIVYQLQKQCANLLPNSQLIGIIEKKKMIQPFIDCGIEKMALWHEILDLSMIKDLINKGIEIWSFTVDHPLQAKRLIEMGVTGIITNCPRLLREYYT